jgi:2-polyprenyl-6-methoxyphenol hydroxylase-like FAD-dependent oxidoreductase
MVASESAATGFFSHETDVLIVGSGPTGLMAATLLARCGVRVCIVDKTDQQSHESRAFGVQAKSLELFLNIGIADEFLNRGLIAGGAQIYLDGKQVAELNFDDIGRPDTPYSFLLMVPQWDIEAILVDDLKRQGIEVLHGIEVTGFTQNEQGVVASATDKAGASHHYSARYLIGADGAHSIVRKSLGLTYQGDAYPQGFLLADCKLDWALDYDHMKLFLRGRHFAVYLPLRGKDVCRVIAIMGEQPAASPGSREGEATSAEPISLEEVQTALREAYGPDVTLHDAVWTTRYRIHHRGVNKYREGRVFVAGDAAHIHSPAGGQGMNTGLQDAANLAWKLAAVLKGGAPESLLDTYHSERWPVGQKVLEFTDRIFSTMTSQTGWLAGIRNMLLPVFGAVITRSGMVRSRAFHFISQLGIRYHEGEFVKDGSSSGASSEWREGPAAGRRAPNGQIARGCDVFSLIQGYRWHVLALSRKPLSRDEIEKLAAEMAALPRTIGIPLETHIVAHSLVGRYGRIVQAESNQVFQAYGISAANPRGLYLIRPDGHVAFRSLWLDFTGLKDLIGCLTGGRYDAESLEQDRETP